MRRERPAARRMAAILLLTGVKIQRFVIGRELKTSPQRREVYARRAQRIGIANLRFEIVNAFLSARRVSFAPLR
jgi:hypothetical protein